MGAALGFGELANIRCKPNDCHPPLELNNTSSSPRVYTLKTQTTLIHFPRNTQKSCNIGFAATNSQPFQGPLVQVASQRPHSAGDQHLGRAHIHFGDRLCFRTLLLAFWKHHLPQPLKSWHRPNGDRFFVFKGRSKNPLSAIWKKEACPQPQNKPVAPIQDTSPRPLQPSTVSTWCQGTLGGGDGWLLWLDSPIQKDCRTQ